MSETSLWGYAALILWVATCGYLAYLHLKDKQNEV